MPQRRLAAIRAIAVCAGLAAAVPAAAQTRGLDLDVIYHPDLQIEFGGDPPTGLAWISEREYHWPRTDRKARTTEHLVVDAATGGTRPLFDAGALERELARAEVAADEARRATRLKTYAFDKAHTALLVSAGKDLFRYELASGRLTRLTRSAEEEEEPGFSPDGRRVAFVRGHDLHVVDAEGGSARALTTDGSADVMNGKLDWIYQEEIYGRGVFKGYWWSPDSSSIAFLQLREAGVPRFTRVDDVSADAVVETTPYPRPGDPNPEARLGIVGASGGPVRWIDLSRHAQAQPLVVDVAWSPRGALSYQVQDREQTWLELAVADTEGRSRTLLRETTRAWVEPLGSPHWLGDGSMLWFSERDGYKHLYHMAADGRVLRQVTRGPWEARVLHGVDAARALVYFSGTERSARDQDVYRVRLDGTGLQRLSGNAGHHAAIFGPAFTRYLDTWSDVVTPPQVRLHAADGALLRVVDENRVPALAEHGVRRPEFLQVSTRDGFAMEAMILKPPDFDPARRYPVYQTTYAGPHAPRVRNAWTGSSHLFLQLLAQKGVVVWVCDNRTASGKGAVSAWPAYKRLGVSELEDIEDGVAWLRAQSFVDPARIGIEGWSYGGFMVSYALTHSRSFAMGIAGGSVTDWRSYDSIYTERYMGLLSRNPDGYRDTAPRLAAAALHGRLLLVHGAFDDNVHPRNTMQLAYELQKAGKPFRMMLYPKQRHAVSEPLLALHLHRLMLDFALETLLGAEGTGGW